MKLIVGIMEPFHGRIYAPACGAGGMFVQSARFVAEHQANPGTEISINGQERVAETVRLAKMNLAVHGLGSTRLQCQQAVFGAAVGAVHFLISVAADGA